MPRIAAYARFSSSAQREASLDDQLRNCRTYCERQGWPAPVEYTDAAMSGARNDRPNFLRMMEDAVQFDVIVVDDFSRLSRDSIVSAQTVRRLTFAGVRLISISDGVDTARKNHKADVGLRGIMSELYLSDLADKTHRGLTGRALAGASAGGLPYGYRVTTTGQREIDEAQAVVVRRIFAEYVAGMSPRAIVAGLNRDGVPSARADHGSVWSMTAVYGDMRRGIGILANPIYVGRYIWNRSQWIKHPDTGRRIRKERPQSEWLTSEHPELAIIDTETWQLARARSRGISDSRAQVEAPRAAGPGRPPRYLLSGILRCGECDGPMVIVDRYRYGCSTHKDTGTCGSRVRISRLIAENALLQGIKKNLLDEGNYRTFIREVQLSLKQSAPDLDAAKRKVIEAGTEHANVMRAIKAGIITPSTRTALVEAELAIEQAKAELRELQSYQPAQILPRAREQWKGIVDRLTDAGRNIPAARSALRELLGDRIAIKNENGNIFAEVAASGSQITVVAGACSVLYLTEPLRIPLHPATDRA